MAKFNDYFNGFIIACLLLLSGCGDSTEITPDNVRSSQASESYIETGDLAALEKRKKLRILAYRGNDDWLPRQSSPIYKERSLVIEFAQQIDLQAEIVYVDNFDQLIPALIAGQGDVVAANLTITDSRKQAIAFTVPVSHAEEQIVAHPSDKSIKNNSSLKNRSIAVKRGTSYEETLTKLQTNHPIKKHIIDGDLHVDDILDRVADKTFDLTIMDSNLLAQAKTYRDDFITPLTVTFERPLAWGIRKDNVELLAAANRYLTQQKLSTKKTSIYTDDFAGIKERKVLRVITRNNASSYFLWRGELLGFEYELAKNFAKKHKLRLEIIVAPSHEDMIPMLIAGKGDMIAAFMTATEERKQQGVMFSRPHHYASEVLVSHINDNRINSIEDLKGRKVHVRRSSAYWNTLQAIKNSGIKFDIVAAPETMETEEIIDKVASKTFDLTVADSHILDIELTWREDIQGALSLTDPRANAWAVRKQNKQLLSAINKFIKKEYRGLFYNITYDKYFKNSHNIKQHKEERIDLNPDGTLSPYDHFVKKYAEQYNFDWRLLVAQMYQESRFDPKATSWVGAKGLMQVMPRTAKELELTDLEDPETGILAGIKYMQWVRDRFEQELDVKDRMWFILAAYNAGQGHVKDARRLARQKGWNPNRWFNHVEKAMLLLAKRKYARKARHGYVRGSEPVDYVRKIKDRYEAYLQLAQAE